MTTIEFVRLPNQERLPHTRISREDVVIDGTYRAKMTYTRLGHGASAIKLVDLATKEVVSIQEMGRPFSFDSFHEARLEMVRKAISDGCWTEPLKTQYIYASKKQINYILDLASKVWGGDIGYFTQFRGRLGICLTRREEQGHITMARAAELIDDLKAMLDREQALND